MSRDDEQKSDDLIAEYREVRVDGKRKFLLYPDEIEISGSAIRSHFETRIALRELNSHPDVLFIRHRFFAIGIGMTSIAVLSMLLASVPQLQEHLTEESLRTLRSGFGFGFLFVGSVICLKSWRKVEFRQFRSRQSGVVLMDVARAGPDRKQFDDFVGN